MVIFHYDNFNSETYIQKNRDFISSEMLINNSKKYQYDSFVLGSSTSLPFAPSVWGEYIQTEQNIFSFDASAENIFGIWSKIKYLDQNGYQIKNILLVLERNAFGPFVNNVPIFMKHPKVYHSSLINFHQLHFLAFMELHFISYLFIYKATGKFYPFMSGLLIQGDYLYDTETNEFYNTSLWESIKQDSIGFYNQRIKSGCFPSRSGVYVEDVQSIKSEHVTMLKEIRSIFDKHKTNYKVVISPTLNQISFNRNDLLVLTKVFEKENVFDFTGINEYSDKISDYYDATHFKKYLADRMLKVVYSNEENLLSFDIN